MNTGSVIRRAIRLAGYNLENSNIEQTELYKQSVLILEENDYIIQRDLNIQNSQKIAVLTEVKNTKDTITGDFNRYEEDFYIYALPNDFISYVGSTFSDYKADVQIMNDYVYVKKPNKYSIVDNRDKNQPWFIYKRKVPVQEISETASRYISIFIALELLMSFKTDDSTKISLLRAELEKERVAILINNNKQFRLNVKRGGMSWRY